MEILRPINSLSAIIVLAYYAAGPTGAAFFAGMLLAASARDIGYCRRSVAVWPVIPEVLDWEKVEWLASESGEEITRLAKVPTPGSSEQMSLEGDDAVRSAHRILQALPHSGFGITSLALALIAGLMIAVPVVVFAGHDGILPKRPAGSISWEAALAVCLCVGVLSALVGAVLGCIGLRNPGRKRLFAILGVCLNGLILFDLVLMVLIGTASHW